jgi:hypothetical protein
MLHEPDDLKSLTESGHYDLIVFGHTHEKSFDKNNGAMLVNPGEGCGWVNGDATLAIVDMSLVDCFFEPL